MKQIPLKSYILLFLIISLSTFIVFYKFTLTEKEFIKQRLDGYNLVINDKIKSTISPFKRSSDLIINSFVKTEKIYELLLESKSSSENIPLNRAILHNELEQTYEYLKKFGISHLHFIDTEGKSFLRFNVPHKYGDSLLNVRSGIKQVVTNKGYIEGFEEGKTFQGYRFIYPLYYYNVFLGAVETSIDLEEIHDRLESTLGGLYYLILDKEKLENTIFEKELKNYSPSIISPKFLHKYSPLSKLEDKEFSFTKEMFLEVNKKIKEEIDTTLESKTNIAITKTIQKQDFIIVFTPIEDIQNENIGYFVSYFIDEEITKVKSLFFERRISVSIVLAVILTIIFLLFYWQKSIKKQKEYYKKVLDSSSNIVIITDGEHPIDANRAFFKFFKDVASVEEFYQKNGCICNFFQEGKDLLIKEINGKKWIEHVLNNPNTTHKAKIVYLDNEKIFSVAANKLNEDEATVILSDITELEEYQTSLEEKVEFAIEEVESKNKILIQQSKMASMGEMIGIIAHQWQQPLNSISLITTTLSALGVDNLSEEKLEKNVGRINDRIEFMSKTIDNFRNFFKPNKQREKFSITFIINEVLEILDGSIKARGIEVEIVGEDIELLSLKNEMEQVFLNIINNAKDALVENKTKSPKITIALEKNKILIADNAGGIPKEHISSIFELYYSTKGDKGTGIGLYMTRMIVEGLGGTIKVKNDSEGAVFTINLNQ